MGNSKRIVPRKLGWDDGGTSLVYRLQTANFEQIF